MRREIPTPVVVIAVVLIVGVLGFYFYWSGRSVQGMGVTRDEMRQEMLRRAKMGQLPPMSPESLRKLQESAKSEK
jgi:hypothetical protein